MKFEKPSFVTAFVVYLVRVRVQYVSETQHLYSGGYLENRSHLYMPDLYLPDQEMPDMQTTSAQPKQEPNTPVSGQTSAMRGGSGCPGSMRNAGGFVRGCSRAV